MHRRCCWQLLDVATCSSLFGSRFRLRLRLLLRHMCCGFDERPVFICVCSTFVLLRCTTFWWSICQLPELCRKWNAVAVYLQVDQYITTRQAYENLKVPLNLPRKASRRILTA